MSPEHGFLEELKRRKVVRAAIVYLAVAWAVVQAADIFVPALGLPDAVLTVAAVLAILGFPVALALAWAFEVTPEGVRRTAALSALSRSAPGTWVGWRTVALAVVLVGGGYWAGAGSGERDSGEGGPGGAARDRTAVAVLPFAARGVGAEDGFAEGMHDDVLTQLSRIDGLRVTSRTSVQQYRETTKTVRVIARELAVGVVLEGGVQRTADRVRVNMQLIDGATDEHLWAETYDRPLTAENVFAIQSEIARAVAVALRTTLSEADEAGLAEVPTTNLAALDLYNRGRRLFWETDNEARSRAIPVLEQAVALDPGFQRAWAFLVLARSWQIRTGASGDTLPAREALDRARALGPESVEAALAEGNYRYYARGDYAGALEVLRQAAAEQSGDPDLLFTVANVLRRLGRWDEATALFREVTTVDPADARAIYELASQHRQAGRVAEAEAEYERYALLRPDEYIANLRAELALLGRGDTAAARSIVAAGTGEVSGDFRRLFEALLGYFRGELPVPLGDLDLGGASEITFAGYARYPAGGPALLEARMRWVLGDREGARRAAAGLAARFLQDTPAIQPGSNVILPGRDIFGARATHLVLQAWEALFAGDADGARALADRAVALHSPDVDAADGAVIVMERAMIRAQGGDPQGAVEDLEWILSVPSYTTPWELRLDPVFDPLRDLPRFRALVAGSGG
ncbi:MAG: tetratricopeptide repeat protein [Longimicrobiales bacterium]|nr:tetratricopeptide repeat protein [Longimicrobiales bacterium]